jgi:hypothetical protein
MKLALMLQPINDRFYEATEAQIRDIEVQIRAALPVDYVSFLQRFGGAMFSGEAYIGSPVARILGIFTIYAAGGEKGSVLSDLQAHPEYVHAGFLPIADDTFNNRFVLKVSSGEVFFIENRHGTSQIVPVAPSFTSFLERIEVTPDAL